MFFELVDAVLASEKVGRRPLVADGPQQRIVTVQPDDRVMQILAGPGSGKTEMLVWRILYELLVIGSPAETLLVTTFTRKAATELEVRLVERCDLLLEEATTRGLNIADPHVHDVRLGTLHALCDALMREFDTSYMTAGTRLVDEHETTVRMARELRFKLGRARAQTTDPLNLACNTPAVSALFQPPWESGNWPSTEIQRVELLRAVLAQHTETWIPRCAARNDRNGIEYSSGAATGITEAFKALHRRWVSYLDDNAIMDFTTIQQRFLERQHTVVPELRHVFVDEFQDTNPVQFAIHVGWLAGPSTRLTVVGDDDQSVYRFRGSDIACFQGLEAECQRSGLSFRQEKLEENHRSTATIVEFSESFRRGSVLAALSMPKSIRPASQANVGSPVRLLTGPWSSLARVSAAELAAIRGSEDAALMPDAAVLMFSTSEKSPRNAMSPGLEMRTALEAAGMRAFNARNKTAGGAGSPVHDLLALISYLIDPVTRTVVPGSTRAVEVFATGDASRRPFAISAEPQFGSPAHAGFQKRFRKAKGGSLATPATDRAGILNFVDEVRARLVQASSAPVDRRRLTVAAFVARLLSFDYFRNCGYTPQLFRQALFTSLLEANVAPTRRTMSSLDDPMRPTVNAKGKIEWPKQYWDLLRVMGTMLEATMLDDAEVDAFSENAIAMLTFHQAKGLEFDHVYVASTGRAINPANVLRTQLFSGVPVSYSVTNGQVDTRDAEVLRLSAADREREVYVALTRARRALTVLHDPTHPRNDVSQLNPAVAAIFDQIPAEQHPLDATVTVKNFLLR
ncbi:UvrD-helicase domain-containing protein [Dactylosporangium darangshiense]|uniref:UvrD-helicase domain-containing protein n=1 Tax=Dactylosporangium darangshiense TaxID=579108 RepID=UPI00362AD1D7